MPRAQVAALQPGRSLSSEIGPRAEIGEDCIIYGCVEGKIGNRCKVWRFAHVMEGATLGDDCMIANGAIVLPGAVLGNGVHVQVGAAVGRNCIVEDGAFIGPGVMFCNARYPRVGMPHSEIEPITVKRGASIGANACLMAGITIGEGATVGALAVVLRDVPDKATVVNPTHAARPYR